MTAPSKKAQADAMDALATAAEGLANETDLSVSYFDPYSDDAKYFRDKGAELRKWANNFRIVKKALQP
jgi:hypothetical protein